MKPSLTGVGSQGRMPVAFSLLVVLTVLVYWPGLGGGFIMDDLPEVAENPALQIDRLDMESLSKAARSFSGGISGREMAMSTFALDFYFWHGDPRGFKLSGLLVHLMNALLIFLLARKLLELDPAAAGSPWPAYAAWAMALVWAIHPLQVSTVLYTVQRMETLAVFFVLVGLLSYLKGRQRQIDGRPLGWLLLGGAGVAMVAGFFSKETAVLLVLFTLSLEWAVLRFRAQSKSDSQALKGIYAAILFIAVVIFLVVFVPRYLDPSAFVHREFSLYERLLSQLRALPLYLSWIVWPDAERYLFYYDSFQHSTGWLRPVTTLLGGLFLLGLAIAAVLARRALPLFSLGVAWFFCAHALTSNIFALELVFEHRNYFALFGVLLALVALLRWMAMRIWQPPARVLAGVTIVGLAGITWVHAATWGEPLNLAMDLKAKNPTSPRAGYQLGHEFMRMADGNPNSPFFGMAEQEYERVRHFDNASPIPERVLIGMRVRADEPIEEELWLDLVAKLRTQAPGAEQVKAVRDLMDMYNQGVALDEEYLMEAGLPLLNSGRMYAYNFYEFGVLALEGLEDEDLAARILLAGFSVAQSENWSRQVLRAIGERGHADFALRLERRLFGAADE